MTLATPLSARLAREKPPILTSQKCGHFAHVRTTEEEYRGD